MRKTRSIPSSGRPEAWSASSRAVSMAVSSGAIQASNWARATGASIRTPPATNENWAVSARDRSCFRVETARYRAWPWLSSSTSISRSIFSGSSEVEARPRMSRMSREARSRASWSQRAKAE